MNARLGYSLLFGLLVLAGCNNSNPRVTGTVKFEDGSPLTVGEVQFVGDKTMSTGMLDGQGRFTLGSLGTKDGCPPGSYKVVIAGARTETADPNDSQPLVGQQFTETSRTPLTAEVTAAGPNEFNLTVSEP